MRIRTIKPEFWRHPVIGRLPDDVKLLALALLNLADDHGYFLADVSLIRGECAPFTEDSLKIHGALNQLEKVGWIEVSEPSEIGRIGRVKKWTKHQKVNRPTDSKLSCYFDSVSPHGGFSEPSRKEQGTGNREHVRPSAKKDDDFDKARTFEIDTDSEEVRNAWNEWQSYRQSRHKATGKQKLLWSHQAARMSAKQILDAVQKFGVQITCDRIASAIAGSWQGLNFDKLQQTNGSSEDFHW